MGNLASKSCIKCRKKQKPRTNDVVIDESDCVDGVGCGELKWGESHWDKLPVELIDMILEHAGMHTKFMCGRLGTVDEIDSMTARAVWHDAFKNSWLGNYSLLPPGTGLNKKFWLTNKDLVLVKSRALYEHLANFLPDMSESNPAYATIDAEIHKSLSTDGKYVIPCNVIKDDDKYRFRLIHIPMRHMWIDLLANKIKKVPYTVARDCIYRGHVDLLRHLLINNIVKIEHLEHYILNDEDEFSYYRMMNAAAELGQLEILKLLHEFGCTSITIWAMNWAALNGHLHVIKWLHENRTEGCTTDAIDNAATNGHLDIAIWLNQNRSEGCTSKAIDNAAKNGHTEIVRLLLHNNFTYTTKAISESIANGHHDIANMLIRHKLESGSNGVNDSVMDGVVQAMIEIIKNTQL